jgi:hypothetical protein
MTFLPFDACGGRNFPGRCLGGRTLIAALLTCALLLGPSSADTVAQTTMATFSIDPAISAEDASDVVEGIRLAQDFFIEEIGAVVDREVHVNVLPEASPLGVELVAVSMGRSIAVYTGSWGWQQSAPSEHISTIVHEYTHYYQYLMTGLDNVSSPAWFEEGIAEYLSLVVLSDLQIVDRADIESYRAGQLYLVPPDRGLSELESFTSFNETGAMGYPLAYFGVSRLFEEVGLEAVSGYYSLLAAGTSFDEAFTLTFGLTPDEHYQQFDRWMSTLSGASEIPADIAVWEAVAQVSPVRIAEVPERVIIDDQMLVRARTVEASACSLSLLAGAPTSAILERSTFADGDGDVFWLVTIPPDAVSGEAAIAIECGGKPVSYPVTIDELQVETWS